MTKQEIINIIKEYKDYALELHTPFSSIRYCIGTFEYYKDINTLVIIPGENNCSVGKFINTAKSLPDNTEIMISNIDGTHEYSINKIEIHNTKKFKSVFFIY